jgi:hypothetical protein
MFNWSEGGTFVWSSACPAAWRARASPSPAVADDLIKSRREILLFLCMAFAHFIEYIIPDLFV